MKILSASQNFAINGGSDRVFFDHNTIFSKYGHEVIPFTSASEHNFQTEWSIYFPRSADFSNPSARDILSYIYSVNAKNSIKNLLGDHRPDVAHLHIYYGKLTSSILKPLVDESIPIVQTLHEYKVVCPVYTMQRTGTECTDCQGYKFYNVAINKCNRNSLARSILSMIESYVSLWNGSVSHISKFIAVSDYLKNRVIEMGIPEEKIVRIYNPIEIHSKEPSYDVGNYFLYYGRLERLKGLPYLLEAFQKMPHLKLKIVGDGSFLHEMHSYINANKLTNVDVVGFKSGNELASIIKGAKAVIVPSTWGETFGLTAAEAMAYGKPVIVSRIGGLTEVVGDSGGGLLIEPNSVIDIIDAVNYIDSDSGRASTMGRAARSHIEKNFSSDIYYKKVFELYDELIGR